MNLSTDIFMAFTSKMVLVVEILRTHWVCIHSVIKLFMQIDKQVTFFWLPFAFRIRNEQVR